LREGRLDKPINVIECLRLEQTLPGQSDLHRHASVPLVAQDQSVGILNLLLMAVYERGPAEIATAVEMLLNHQHLTVQDPDAIAAAVEHFRGRPALGFSDCLVLAIARKAGHLPLGTFDRSLAKLDGTHRL